jgi:type IV pilus assembly protein PilA
MERQIRAPVIKRVILDGELNQLVSLSANAKLVGFNDQLNYILSTFFFGDSKMAIKNITSNKSIHNNSKASGFTLIELLLVVAIIGIISAIAIPVFLAQRANARDKATVANLTGNISNVAAAVEGSIQAQGGITQNLPAAITATLPAGVQSPWGPAGTPAFATSNTVGPTAPSSPDPAVSIGSYVAGAVSAATTAAGNIGVGQVGFYVAPAVAATYDNTGNVITAAVPGILVGVAHTSGTFITKAVSFEN